MMIFLVRIKTSFYQQIRFKMAKNRAIVVQGLMIFDNRIEE